MLQRIDIRVIGLLLLCAGLAAALLSGYPDTWVGSTIVRDFYANASTELMSIAITVLIIDRIYEVKTEEQNKKRLVWEMGSTDRAFAARATKELRDNGLLSDGSLKGIDLELANLEGANLENAVLDDANLKKANLKNANLQAASLCGSRLDGSALYEARLDNAALVGSHLPRARLQKATLERVDISGRADLLGASFASAVLRNANLSDAQLEEVDFRNADLTGAQLIGAMLLRANLEVVNFNNAYLDRSDLSEVTNWDKIRNISGASLSGIRNAPLGFHEWAVANGAKEQGVRGEAD